MSIRPNQRTPHSLQGICPDVERPTEVVDSFAALSAAVHPAWHQAILRLANSIERVSKELEPWAALPIDDGNFVPATRRLVQSLIDVLDNVDADPDLEPWLGTGMHGGDDREAEDEHDEPSLGWTDREAMRGRYYGVTDRELDRSDYEPDADMEVESCYGGRKLP